MHSRLVRIAALTMVAIAACSTADEETGTVEDTPEDTDVPETLASLNDLEWRLVSFGEHDPLPQDVEITAAFTDGRVSGSGGCNRYNAEYVVTGAGIEISEIMGTRMACPEPAASLETEYFGALVEAELFVLDGDRLTIKSRAGDVLTYEASGVVIP